MNVVVLISGSGSNLQAIIDGMQNGNLPINITAVISNQPGVYGLQRAVKTDIPAMVVRHSDYQNRELYDAELIKVIDQHQPDLVVLAGFMRILTPGFTQHYQNRLMNIHPSLLPKFTGLHTHQRALDAKEKWHGASVHFVIPELDAGPVIIQGKLPITEDDTSDSLQQRIHKIEHIIYPLAVKWFAEQRLSIDNDSVLLDNAESELQKQTFPF